VVLSRVLIEIVLERETRATLRARKRPLLLHLRVSAPMRLERRFAVEVPMAFLARKSANRSAVRVRELNVFAQRSHSAKLPPTAFALVQTLSAERVVALQMQREVKTSRKAFAAARHRALDRTEVSALVLRQPLTLKKGLRALCVVAFVDTNAAALRRAVFGALAIDAMDAVVAVSFDLVLEKFCAVMTNVMARRAMYEFESTDCSMMENVRGANDSAADAFGLEVTLFMAGMVEVSKHMERTT